MPEHSSYRLNNPSDETLIHLTNALRSLDRWRAAMQPMFDKAFNDLKAEGHLSTTFADALDDFGNYVLSKASEVRAERKRLGIGVPKKLPPAKY
ncbi:hypothetical protein [Methylobacterium brachythecii]|uniref:Uncharacterized protein n=1 Tax=Methylobacterium brachythecii TaxID=1176177 RepID=A0A7W6ART9_9HYPH|nr:hypothetical protein [Methylobacterium brachythecii]MBB3904772.1 hypothetical protein [Methylobacterium brachythecii]GLS45550.1 hypothetical protein GCM10007884_35410 [Methylobacterium brachythecii]